jgi:phosphoenolpyruvate synthase/pyruvate phosphate dikinase
MIQLIQSGDGHLVIANNQSFPSTVQRVEYFRDLKLLMLAFDDDEENNELMTHEINDDVVPLVKNAANIVILELKAGVEKQIGYLAPLVQIGL